MKNSIIRKIYLYTFALVGLVLIVIAGVRLVNLGIKAYVLTKADQYWQYPVPQTPETTKGGNNINTPSQKELDEYQKNQTTSQRQRDAAESLAMLIIGVPLYLYHWTVIKRDQKKETETNA